MPYLHSEPAGVSMVWLKFLKVLGSNVKQPMQGCHFMICHALNFCPCLGVTLESTYRDFLAFNKCQLF
jgi:hypothetical protein